MSKLCELTGKRPQTGHNVSHANNKTKRRFFPNLKKVSFKSEKLNRDIRIKICTRAIKALIARVQILIRISRFNFSLLKETFLRFGKNLLLVLLLA